MIVIGKIKDDLIFAKRTKKALERYDKSPFNKTTSDKLLKELKKW